MEVSAMNYVVNLNGCNIDDEWDCTEKFKTKHDAINYAKQQYKLGETTSSIYQIARYNIYKVVVDADNMIEDVCNKAYEDIGDIAENFLDSVTKQDRQLLETMINKTFNDWLKKTGNDSYDFGTIEDVETLEI